MAYPIRTTEVRRVMQPVLGTRITSQTPLCEQVAEVLRHYRPARETADELCVRLKDVIFGSLYELLGHQMMLQMDNGAVRRIFLRDVDYLVDESVGLLLGAMEESEISLEGLRAYAMEQGSLAAMRVMLQRYGNELSAMEREMLQRIIRENDPYAAFGRE